MSKKTSLFILIVALFCGIGFLLKPTYKPKVYNCFLFYDEFENLDIRLNELGDKVEKFILVEADRTFQNKPKPLFFEENKEKYAKFKDKIVHVIIDQYPEFPPIGTEDYWDAENFIRDRIKVGLKLCKPNKRDIVLLTDADEIIRKDKIDDIVQLIDKEKVDLVFGSLSHYCAFLNRKDNMTIDICIATSFGNFNKYIRSGQDLRNFSGFSKGHANCGFRVMDKIRKAHPDKKWSFAKIDNTGWHFSSLGGYQTMLQKLDAQAHVKNNTAPARNFEYMKKSLETLKFCEIDNTYPQYVVDHLEEFRAKGMIDKEITTFH